MINQLDWDSKFFNKKIGRFDASKVINFDEFYENAKSFDLVYVFSDKPLDINAKLVDIKLTFEKPVENYDSHLSIEQYQKDKHDYNQLLELAYLSGHESRFKNDKFFSEEDFKRLYEKWLDKNINESHQHVLVYVENDTIAGFVSYETQAKEAFINLIAVDPNFQGKGIGKKLMREVENKLSLSSALIVPTQKTNKSAVIFYEHNGFTLRQEKYIYHYTYDTI